MTFTVIFVSPITSPFLDLSSQLLFIRTLMKTFRTRKNGRQNTLSHQFSAVTEAEEHFLTSIQLHHH